MNRISLFSLRMLLGFTLFMSMKSNISAHAQDLMWAKRAGGTDSEIGHDIAVDASGNIYVTGTMRGSATFGPGETNETIVTSAGLDDFFVAKYNSAGALLWVKRAGSTNFDDGYGIGIDASGNCYITGRFTGSVTFGQGEDNQTTLNSSGSIDIFVAKFNSSGALLWARQAGSLNIDTGFGIAVDASGNSYLTGVFTGSATFGSEGANHTTLIGVSNEIFVAKYNSSGDLMWARRAGGSDSDAAYGIAIDASGNCSVTGLFTGSATFGPGESNQTILTSTGGSTDIFVAKFNNSGDLLWAKPAGSSSSGLERGWSIAVDALHNTYVTGVFVGEATFGLGEAGQTTLTSAGAEEGFVAKYNSSGDLLWAKQAGGAEADVSFAIAVDALSNCYITGRFAGAATFASGEGNQTILTSAGSHEIFLATYNSSGNLLSVKQAGGIGNDTGLGIAVDASGNIYLTGNFAEVATFGQAEANQTLLTGSGAVDFFLAKFQVAAPPTVSAGGPYSANEGGSVMVTATGNDPENGPLTYAWDLDNDGSFETSGQSVNFSAMNLDGPSTHTIKVQITGNAGLAATAEATVNVLNLAPTASFASLPGTLIAGQSATLAFSNQADPSATDVAAGFKYSFDCTNDGTFEISEATTNFHIYAYPASGIYTATGRIQDKDGDFNVYNIQVTVLTPQDAVHALIAQVQALNKPQVNGMIGKLNVVIKRLDKNEIDKAIDMLQQFIAQVEVFMRNGTFSAAEGQPLIDAANAIIAALSIPSQPAVTSLKKDAAADFTTALPTEFQMEQNYPNPFNPTTTINFALPEASEVSLAIYDLQGQLVRKLVAGEVSAGYHSVVWNARDENGQQVASGVYLYIVKAGSFTAQRKLVLTK